MCKERRNTVSAFDTNVCGVFPLLKQAQDIYARVALGILSFLTWSTRVAGACAFVSCLCIRDGTRIGQLGRGPSEAADGRQDVQKAYVTYQWKEVTPSFPRVEVDARYAYYSFIFLGRLPCTYRSGYIAETARHASETMNYSGCSGKIKFCAQFTKIFDAHMLLIAYLLPIALIIHCLP